MRELECSVYSGHALVCVSAAVARVSEENLELERAIEELSQSSVSADTHTHTHTQTHTHTHTHTHTLVSLLHSTRYQF